MRTQVYFHTSVLFDNVGWLELGVALELVQAKVGELNDPPRVHQTVRGAEGAVKFNDRLVKVHHALFSQTKKI